VQVITKIQHAFIKEHTVQSFKSFSFCNKKSTKVIRLLLLCYKIKTPKQKDICHIA